MINIIFYFQIGECKSWCATSVDSEGNCLPDQWGYCGEDCVFTLPHPGSINEKTVNDDVDDEEASQEDVVTTTLAPTIVKAVPFKEESHKDYSMNLGTSRI